MNVHEHPDDHLADHLATLHHGITTAAVNTRVDAIIRDFEDFRRTITGTLTAIAASTITGLAITVWLALR